MKKINRDNSTGGRPLFINDILTLEENVYKGYQAQFQNHGAFIISGAVSTSSAISPGVVIIDNEVMSFEGVTGVTFPVYLVREETFVDNAVFQDGTTKPLYVENKAVISTTIPSSGEYIAITASGGKRYMDVLMTELVGLKGNQTISGNKSFTNTVTIGGIDIKNNITILNQKVINLLDKINTKASSLWTENELKKKADIAQEGWKNLTLLNNATKHPAAVYGGPIPDASYMKDSLGFVHLRGVVWAKIDWGTIAQLPAGYRPEYAVNLDYASDGAVCHRILPDGNIWVSGSNITLDGIIFKAV